MVLPPYYDSITKTTKGITLVIPIIKKGNTVSKTISFKCDDWLYDQLKNQTKNTSQFIKDAIEEKLGITKPEDLSEIQKLWSEIETIKEKINSNTTGNTKGIAGNTKSNTQHKNGNTENNNLSVSSSSEPQPLSANQLRALEVISSIDQSLEKMSDSDKTEILSSRYPKNEFRKRMAVVVSKDSISKYWEKIEEGLKA